MQPDHHLTRVEAASEVQQFLEDRLYEFNLAAVGKQDGELFAFVIRDKADAIVAGISGWTWARACEIQHLWVAAEWRGHGYGGNLLRAAEEAARSRGCQAILLTSYSFQAPGFYRKHGYEIAYRLDDFPPGHSYSMLVKKLPPGNST